MNCFKIVWLLLLCLSTCLACSCSDKGKVDFNVTPMASEQGSIRTSLDRPGIDGYFPIVMADDLDESTAVDKTK